MKENPPMMRLELFVEDKKLAPVLHAIDGNILKMTIGPVYNAVKRNGKLTEAGHPTTGKELVNHAIRAAIANNKGKFDTTTIKQLAAQYGIQSDRFHARIHDLKVAGMIRRTSIGKYIVTKKGMNNG